MILTSLLLLSLFIPNRMSAYAAELKKERKTAYSRFFSFFSSFILVLLFVELFHIWLPASTYKWSIPFFILLGALHLFLGWRKMRRFKAL
jgi:hypothetical protein